MKAINRVLTPSSAATTHQRHRKQTSTRDPLFFHLKFNPFDPRASAYQKIFQDTIVDPPGKPHISTIDTGNLFKGKPDFDRLITCFHGQRKLGSILAPRKHRFGANFSVSEFIKSHPLNWIQNPFQPCICCLWKHSCCNRTSATGLFLKRFGSRAGDSLRSFAPPALPLIFLKIFKIENHDWQMTDRHCLCLLIWQPLVFANVQTVPFL